MTVDVFAIAFVTCLNTAIMAGIESWGGSVFKDASQILTVQIFMANTCL